MLERPGPETLRQLMKLPDFSSLVLGKMQERLARTTSIGDLPRFGGFDQSMLRQMREESAAPSEEGEAA